MVRLYFEINHHPLAIRGSMATRSDRNHVLPIECIVKRMDAKGQMAARQGLAGRGDSIGRHGQQRKTRYRVRFGGFPNLAITSPGQHGRPCDCGTDVLPANPGWRQWLASAGIRCCRGYVQFLTRVAFKQDIDFVTAAGAAGEHASSPVKQPANWS